MPLQEEPDLNANRTSLHGTHRHTHTHTTAAVPLSVSACPGGRGCADRVSACRARRPPGPHTAGVACACDEPDLPHITDAPTFRSLRL